MKVNSSLKKYIKNMSGKLIGIGIDDLELINEIDKNNKILECDLLNSESKNGFGSGRGKNKKLNIKKIRRKYKKKNVNYIIVNSSEIGKYLKSFVKDSIYINNKEIYYYTKNKYDIDTIVKRYRRYNTKIDILKCEDGTIIKIDTSCAKNHLFKDKIYYIIDTLSNIADLIGDILIS